MDKPPTTGTAEPNPDDNEPIPRKLSGELIEAFKVIIQEGNYRATACNRLGISPRTFTRWMAAGKKYPNGLYGHLRLAVLESEGAAERNAIKSILASGHFDDVKHLEWWLERKYPQRWGRDRGVLQSLLATVQRLEAQMSKLNAGLQPETFGADSAPGKDV